MRLTIRNILKGSGQYLRSFKAILLEVSVLPIYKEVPGWLEILDYLESQGFRVSSLIPVTNDGQFVIEYDCLMIRE